uniref:Transmembrane protein n=1 Tax=Jeilongvirus beilongi TaxID=3052263 RepID=A0A9Y1W1T6_9MONO|nr:transmembrane protein [Jeilongvirus beilongi]
MTSDYEDPASMPSCYGSMRSSGATYKATQIRRPYQNGIPRSLKSGYSIATARKNTNIYFAFILFVSSVNMAMLCYIIISMEAKNCAPERPATRPLPKVDNQNCPELDQISSSINTMMHALTYTLPQVLTSNKHALVSRLNHLAFELRETVRMNNLDLNVRLGLNRTIALRTGSNTAKITATSSGPIGATKPPLVPVFTLVPPRATSRVMFYPLMKGEGNMMSDENLENVRRLNKHHNPNNGGMQDDIAVLNPTF